MSARLPAFIRGPSGLGQETSSTPAAAETTSSPAGQRDDAKRNFLKSMRPLPLQHYWDVYFDGPAKPADGEQQQQQQQQPPQSGDSQQSSQLQKIGDQVESVQDFWRYSNNLPVAQMRMRDAIYLFKSGFRPVWEDRRNILGGSWTFRVSKDVGPAFWTRIQLLAIGETLQDAIGSSDQICGVGISVRFNAHLVTIWNRDSFNKKSVDALIACVLAELPPELQPKPDSYYYKRHAERAGFAPPPELRAVLESQLKAEAAVAKA
ncbi:Eukaryotic translation initiation factor 4E type 3 [Escovopsis weberi]|uniref:Eukaryotic translation initiation factor 4E type 3 n=1 Tax=Escovopsis weberi TaxID=150374 RepID=A0A0M8MWY3_ESCWE|nr:Eukaryotic translation initiation factor 4E type 3 [Escovopsis weberi]